MQKKINIIEMQVRAYECDFQGIVNNAVYMNYLEHARMSYGKAMGIDVVTLAKEGVIWVVNEARLQYKSSLRPGDDFEIITSTSVQGVMRGIFHQEIKKKDSGELILQSEIITACIINGYPGPLPQVIREKMAAS